MKKLETVIKDLKRSLENVKEYPDRSIITMPPQDARMLLNAIEEALAELSTEGLKLSDDLVVKSLAAIHKSEQPDLPAPNTVMWWLCRMADPEIRRKAVERCTTEGVRNQDAYDACDAIGAAFLWYATEEGYGYWNDIAFSQIPLLPTPEWKEYLELRK